MSGSPILNLMELLSVFSIREITNGEFRANGALSQFAWLDVSLIAWKSQLVCPLAGFLRFRDTIPWTLASGTP
jgi:hypothetical protein